MGRKSENLPIETKISEVTENFWILISKKLAKWTYKKIDLEFLKGQLLVIG